MIAARLLARTCWDNSLLYFSFFFLPFLDCLRNFPLFLFRYHSAFSLSISFFLFFIIGPLLRVFSFLFLFFFVLFFLLFLFCFVRSVSVIICLVGSLRFQEYTGKSRRRVIFKRKDRGRGRFPIGISIWGGGFRVKDIAILVIVTGVVFPLYLVPGSHYFVMIVFALHTYRSRKYQHIKASFRLSLCALVPSPFQCGRPPPSTCCQVPGAKPQLTVCQQVYKAPSRRTITRVAWSGGNAPDYCSDRKN